MYSSQSTLDPYFSPMGPITNLLLKQLGCYPPVFGPLKRLVIFTKLNPLSGRYGFYCSIAAPLRLFLRCIKSRSVSQQIASVALYSPSIWKRIKHLPTTHGFFFFQVESPVGGVYVSFSFHVFLSRGTAGVTLIVGCLFGSLYFALFKKFFALNWWSSPKSLQCHGERPYRSTQMPLSRSQTEPRRQRRAAHTYSVICEWVNSLDEQTHCDRAVEVV